MVFGSHFIFDGIDSRDYDLLLCSFDGYQDEEQSMGLSIEPINIELRDKIIDYGGKWSEVITFDFTVVHRNGEPFPRREIREIASWLTSSKDLKWLSVYDEDDTEFFYFCRFTNISQKLIGGKTVALILEITCDSPFAYSDIKEVEIYNKEVLSDAISISDYELILNTDVEIVPNIIMYQENLSDEVKFDLYARNDSNNSGIKFINYESKSGKYLFDLNNLFVLYSENSDSENIENYSIVNSTVGFYEMYGIVKEDLGLILSNGENLLNIIIFADEGSSSIPLGNYRIVLQYREKYKVGVF